MNQARRMIRLRSVILFVAVGMVAALLGGTVGVLIGRSPRDQSAVVSALFTSLASGDATTATSLLAWPPADTSFLSNDVVRIGRQNATISNVTATATSASTVSVSYRLGDVAVEDVIPVTTVGSQFRVAVRLNGGGIPVGAHRSDAVPVFVAGRRVTTDEISLFPGSYPVTTTSPYLSYGTGTLVVRKLSDSATADDFALRVTGQGQEAIDSAVTASLAACAAQRVAAPQGCPFRFSTSADLADQELTWTVTTSGQAATTGDITDPTAVPIQVSVTARLTVGTQEARTLPASWATGTVDLTAPTPTVRWRA